MLKRVKRMIWNRVSITLVAVTVSFASISFLSTPITKADDHARGTTETYYTDDTYQYVCGECNWPCFTGITCWGESSAWFTTQNETCNGG